MRYLAELYYFYNHHDLLHGRYWDNITLIAQTIGKDCRYYTAGLTMPKKGVKLETGASREI